MIVGGRRGRLVSVPVSRYLPDIALHLKFRLHCYLHDRESSEALFDELRDVRRRLEVRDSLSLHDVLD